jgi:hypothetical protein
MRGHDHSGQINRSHGHTARAQDVTGKDDIRTPYERMTEFARKIVRVPKSEVAKPPTKRRKKRRHRQP